MAHVALFLTILVLSILSAALSSPISSRRWMYGECYNVITPKEFDLTTFTTGTWYEISRVYNDFEKHADCVKVTFFKENQNLDIIFSAHFQNLTEGTIAATATFAVNENETNIQATFPGDTDAMPLDILATDFKNYAILYSCIQLTNDVIPEKEERIWVLSRRTYFEDDIQEIVDDALYYEGSDIGFLLEPVNQICKPGC